MKFQWKLNKLFNKGMVDGERMAAVVSMIFKILYESI